MTSTQHDRTVASYTEILGFKKLMDFNPGAFLAVAVMLTTRPDSVVASITLVNPTAMRA